jgi:D-alanine-D-alanine ligase
MTQKITVALLSGGTSTEREVSIRSGNEVFRALDRETYEVRRYDPKTDLPRLLADARKIDIAMVLLHGINGEDGTVQGLLDLLKIPYQCSGPLGSAVAMHKLAAKHLYESAGIPVPPYLSFKKTDAVDINRCADRLGLPLVIKPVRGGSSIGMGIEDSRDNLPAAFERAFAHDDTVLVEAYIRGIEITGGVIGNEDLEALPIIEIVPKKTHSFFDYEAKYQAGETQEICPARIRADFTQRAQDLAIKAHRALFCEGYSRTDMIIRDEEIFVLETNTVPGMTSNSLLPKAAGVAGMSFSRLLDRLIELGLKRHHRWG